jgi:hypothetical protein
VRQTCVSCPTIPSGELRTHVGILFPQGWARAKHSCAVDVRSLGRIVIQVPRGLGRLGVRLSCDPLLLGCLGMFRDVIWVPLIMVPDTHRWRAGNRMVNSGSRHRRAVYRILAPCALADAVATQTAGKPRQHLGKSLPPTSKPYF